MQLAARLIAAEGHLVYSKLAMPESHTLALTNMFLENEQRKD